MEGERGEPRRNHSRRHLFKLIVGRRGRIRQPVFATPRGVRKNKEGAVRGPPG